MRVRKAKPRDGAPTAEASEYAEAVAFFQQNRADLRRRYHDQFIAILDGRVLDSDIDYRALVERCRRSCVGHSPFLAYAASEDLSNLLRRFAIPGAVEPAANREAWETEAVREVIKPADD